MTITIYHNPACGTSRNTLAMIRQSGVEPEIIEYLKTPPSREKLVKLFADMGMGPRDLLRRKGTPYDELGLEDLKWTSDELIGFMLAHPILINRPIVITPKGTRLCRPSEVVLNILPNPDIGPFTKDDGEVVRGWLGVQIQAVTSGIADSLGLKNTNGALVDEARPDSDIDVFIEYDPGSHFSLFELAGIEVLIAETLGVDAEVTTRNSLHPLLKKRIESSAIQVF